MSSVDERIDSPVEQHSPELSAMLDRQRRAILADGTPSVVLRRGFVRTAGSSAVAPTSPDQLHPELLGRHRMAFGAADFD